MTGARQRAGAIPGPLSGGEQSPGGTVVRETHTPRFLQQLDPAVLRELAWLLEHRNGRVKTFVDPKRAAAELADILDRGGTPTIGWWKRNLRARDRGGDPPDRSAGPP